MPVDDEVEQPPQQEPDAVAGQIRRPSQRATTPSMSNRGSLRTVMSAREVARRPARW